MRKTTTNESAKCVREIVKEVYGVVVDNIFIFLPQECVSSFGIVTLKDLLVETEKAVGVESMYNLHMELQKLKSKNIPVVAVFLTGRQLWVNAELNSSDAFVVAWLPGTEGGGIADVLVAIPIESLTLS